MSDTYPGRRQRPAKTGRSTPARASERRKLVRLADEIADAEAEYRAKLTAWEGSSMGLVSAVLLRLADGIDVPERDHSREGESCEG